MLQPETNEVQDVAVAHAIAGQVRFFPQVLLVEHATSHRQDAPQLTPPAQPPREQSTEHAPGPQVTALAHALFPQLTTQSDDDEQSTPLLQAPSAQVTAHGPAPQDIRVAQDDTPHCTAQLEERVQSIAELHAPSPHVTLQGPEPQVMAVGHAVAPVQTISQLDA